MVKIQFSFVVFVSFTLCCIRASDIQYQQLNENKNNQHLNENSKDTWRQPMPQMNNWIIMKSGGKTTVAPVSKVTTMLPYNHRNTHRNSYNTLLSNVNVETYVKTQQQQQQQIHKQKNPVGHFPINYFTYNHSTAGNYQNVKLIEPYFVTLNKMRARTRLGLNEPDSYMNPDVASRQHLVSYNNVVSSPFAPIIKLPKDVLNNIVTPQMEQRKDNENAMNKNNNNNNINNIDLNGKRDNKSEFSSADDGINNDIEYADHNDDEDANSNTDADADVDIINEMKIDGTHLNEILLPLQQTLDKVIYFCDIAKRFISNTEINESDNDVSDNDLYKMTEVIEMNTRNPTVDASTEVQGHHSVPSSSSSLTSAATAAIQSIMKSSSTTQSQSRNAVTSLSTIGTGRKLKKIKKKLSKFVLPLLLAYKLKFLTLIPVLIGGLTLLVGTTGLAGFFFALFTAVMSLKGTGSSKSIIVKKI